MSQETTGLAISSFDLFHVGHLSAVRQALAQVDTLVLAVADDALVEARRGAPPLVPQAERLEVLAAFFPDVTIEITDSDAIADLVAHQRVDHVLVCVPEGVDAPATVGGLPATALRYETTTSPSLLANLEPEILWVPS